MRRAAVILFAIAILGSPLVADDAPRSLDPRLKIELFAEQPLIATPTGLDVDSRGRIWAIECNTHFRPENYPGHPSDRVLVFRDRDANGKAKAPVTFADGFSATMSVAVRPVWMPPVRLPGIDQGDAGVLAKTTQVYLATRNQVLLLEDANGDDVCDRQTVLFSLDTKGNYPHNGFAGFAFDALGAMFIGMGENLGEPYKVRDRSGAVVYEHDEGGHIYRCRPDGTNFELWAAGCWNPHSSCFDAFGRMFSVDNDPDSRPPCRLLHIVKGGDYGFHFKNGRKGLHPFTSWDGELPGTLPMVAGTGEAPSGVIAYEHDALPAEYRGHLMATSWGDHRIDVFRLKPRGLSFESVAEPFIVGGENFRPVGLALAPDGSLYCTDWVLRDYKLHGKGRVWRISAVDGAHRAPDFAAIQSEDKPAILQRSLESPIGLERRVAARRMVDVNGLQNVRCVKDASLSERTRYEALAAVVVRHEGDETRQLKEGATRSEAPFDSVQTLLAEHFGEPASLARIQSLLADLQGSDPMYVLGGIKVFNPIIAAIASGSASERLVELLNAAVDRMDAFALSTLVQVCSERFSSDELNRLIASPLKLHSKARLAFLLAAKRVRASSEAVVKTGLERPDLDVRRAAVQWAAERRMTALRPQVQSCLSTWPTSNKLVLSTIAALEMLDGKDPKDFDKTPAGKYVTPLLKDDKTTPEVLTIALRLVDPDDPAVTVERLRKFLSLGSETLRAEVIRTLANRRNADAIDAILELARSSTPNDLEILSALIQQFAVHSDDERLKSTLLTWSTKNPIAVSSFRGGRAKDPATIERLELLFREWTAPGTYIPGHRELLQSRNLIFPERETLPIPQAASTIDLRKELVNPGRPAEDSTHGRMVFFHPNGPGCAKCHTIDGRGGKVGPDLSRIGASLTREKLVDSILDPSREVSPQFTNWQMVSTDGRIFTGMIVHENEGITILGDAEGKTIELKTADIEERRPLKSSVMPEKLTDRMTVQEFRDLIRFLAETGRDSQAR